MEGAGGADAGAQRRHGRGRKRGWRVSGWCPGRLREGSPLQRTRPVPRCPSRREARMRGGRSRLFAWALVELVEAAARSDARAVAAEAWGRLDEWASTNQTD